MPAFQSFAISPEQMDAMFPPVPPAPEPSREAQLEAALDAMLMRQLEQIIDRAMLDELCVDNAVAADRLLALAIRSLTWRREQLRPKAPPQ